MQNAKIEFISEDKLRQFTAIKKVIFYNNNVRKILFQTVVLIAIFAFFYVIIRNAATTLESRGITTGFGFLKQTAGFDIGFTLIDYTETDSYLATFVVGLLNTVLVSVLGILFATILGFIIGVARLSSNWLVRHLAAAYIEIFRNIPLLLQLFFWYFAVLQALPSARNSFSLGDTVFLNVRGLFFPSLILEPGSGWILSALVIGVIATIILSIGAKNRQKLTGKQTPMFSVGFGLIIVVPALIYFLAGAPISADYPHLKGFNFSGGICVIPELVALLLGLSICTAAFIAEIVRSGLIAVDSGQHEAAMSLGLPRGKTLKLIVIPQALRIIIPPLTSEYLNLTKNSSLAMAIGYPDLFTVFAGTTLNQTGQAVEIIAMTMGVFLILSLITSVLMNLYNKKNALVGR